MDLNITIDILIILKLIIATLIGLLIGRERKRNEKPGGSRTFAMVCLGSALIAILSLKLIETGLYSFDFVRLLAYGIAGISFLGSGIIIHHKNNVLGLTSASTLWVLVPVGYCIGLGYFQLGMVTAALMYFILEMKYKFHK